MDHCIKMLTGVFENLFEGICLFDIDQKIIFWNGAAEQLTGFPREDVVGIKCSEEIFLHLDENGENLCGQRCPTVHTIKDGETREQRVYIRHREGHRISVLSRVSPLRDESGTIIGACEVLSDQIDIKERESKIEELERLAMHDELTSLPNRRYLESHLEAQQLDFDRFGWTFGVILVDIDRFKSINDAYGHGGGDLVLQNIAKTLLNGVRGRDLIGRWGGEEFLAIISSIDGDGLMRIASRLRSLVEKSFTMVSGMRINVTVSLGTALFVEGESLDSILKRSDHALYQAKNNGRNRIESADRDYPECWQDLSCSEHA